MVEKVWGFKNKIVWRFNGECLELHDREYLGED